MSTPREQLADELTHYLTGYGRHDRTKLSLIAGCADWVTLAQREHERRQREFLEILPTECVVAIARGDVDLSQLAAEVLERLSP